MSFDRSLSFARAEQAREHLAIGNRIRSLRAALWADWKQAGRSAAALDAAALMLDPPLYLANCRVELLLGRIPTIGRMKQRESTASYRPGRRLEQMLREVRIPLAATVGTLTPRQRTDLADLLRRYADPAGWSADLLRRRYGK